MRIDTWDFQDSSDIVLGSTQADRSLQKLYHPAGRLGGRDRRSDLACDEWPETAVLPTLSHL
jgi:hypothetical protein